MLRVGRLYCGVRHTVRIVRCKGCLYCGVYHTTRWWCHTQHQYRTSRSAGVGPTSAAIVITLAKLEAGSHITAPNFRATDSTNRTFWPQLLVVPYRAAVLYRAGATGLFAQGTAASMSNTGTSTSTAGDSTSSKRLPRGLVVQIWQSSPPNIIFKHHVSTGHRIAGT
eukprot:3847437-Rhodomonas_salina.4